MKIFIYCCFCLILISCKDATIENKIYNDLKKEKRGEINLKDYVNFEWDSAYLFQFPLSHNEINNILNIKYNHYVEFTRAFVFIKNNKVVYYENLPTNIEKITNGQLIYKDLSNTDKFIKINYNNPNLKAKIEKEEGLEYVIIE